MNLLEKLMVSKLIKCEKCGGSMNMTGWGEDEHGIHARLECLKCTRAKGKDGQEA